MITAIIPTLNAAGSIRGLIEALKRDAPGEMEILVVDSSSADGTVQAAMELGARVETLHGEGFDHGGTRTLAGKSARGDFLVYLTQDAMPAGAGALRQLLKPFGEDETIGAVYGRQLPSPEATPFAAHLRHFNYPAESSVKGFSDRARYGIKTPFLSNSFTAYRKEALEAVGWFGADLICSEDLHAGAKLLLAGYKLAYAADAQVVHSHNYGAMKEARRYFDIGVFHVREDWILEEFGGAGREGKRFIKSGLRYIADDGRLSLVPEFLLRNVLKYVFYNLGKRHKYLPAAVRLKLSNNPGWWIKNG